jgi:aminomethyltransferase
MTNDTKHTKQTGFHPRTSKLTQDYAQYNGYWLANTYEDYGATAEYRACRDAVIVTDLSALEKLEITGPDAEVLLQWSLGRDIRRLAVGQITYSTMCYDTGGILDEGTVQRLGADNFRWVGGNKFAGDWLRKQAEERGLRAWVQSSTQHLSNLAVQGPNSREVLRNVIWTPPAQPTLDELGWFRLAIGRIEHADGVPIVVTRTGYTGELGYEIWCHPTHAPQVWDAVWQAGEPHGIAPLGLEALDILRIEAGLVAAGAEYDDQVDPYEAGIGFTVALPRKEDDFVGRDALMLRKDSQRQKLVGLEYGGETVAGNGDKVYVGGVQVGTITSSARSPILRKNIALCRIDMEHSALNNEVDIALGESGVQQPRSPATVIAYPFYDPKKLRVRS